MTSSFRRLAIFAFAALCALPARAQEFKLSHQWKQGSDGRDLAAQLFIKEVTSKDPSIKFRVYPGASLISNPVKQLDALQDGTIDLTIYPLIYGVGKIPELSVTILPGAISNVKTAARLRDSEYAQKLQELAVANGFRILTWWWTEGGFAVRNRPITDPSSVEGLKLRGADRTLDAMMKQAGASVFSMPSTELYSALQSGVIDGLLTSNETMVSMRLYEQTKYATLGGDYTIFLVMQPLLISNAAWKKLSPVQQQIFRDAALKSESFFTNEQIKLNGEVAEVFKKAGVQVRQMTKAEYDKWIELAKRTAWPQFAGTSPLSKDLVDSLTRSLSR
jgi:TRAP-type C4-dicarboxylate transport system substrate-binding protein